MDGVQGITQAEWTTTTAAATGGGSIKGVTLNVMAQGVMLSDVIVKKAQDADRLDGADLAGTPFVDGAVGFVDGPGAALQCPDGRAVGDRHPG